MGVLVSVILPAYNAGPYITDAVKSILEQTFTNFELIIVNDCSTDNTEQEILKFNDPRIRYYKNEQNLGLILTLNKLIALAQGKYLARMDADDISINTRLEKQVNFLEQNPDIGIVSCGFQNFGNNNESVYYKQHDDDIKLKLLYKTEVCHAAALIRTSLAKQHTPFYNIDYKHAEDYELWARMTLYTRFYNLQEILYKVRIVSTSVSRVFANIQQENTNAVIRYLFNRFNITLNDNELNVWLQFCYANFNLNGAEIKLLDSLLNALVENNKTVHYINQAHLEQHLAEKWFHMCYNNAKNQEVKTIFKNSKITALLPLKNRLKFWLKGLF